MEFIIWIIAFAITITVHEASHAWMADRLGDPTAKLSGRLSLNPIKHYDPVGTTLLLGLTIMRSIGIPVVPFGWAKPVPIDPYNLKNPKKDAALISLSGPISNILVAVILAVILRLIPTSITFVLTYPIILLNIVLATFNLIPIHPLDGGKILVGILPEEEARELDTVLNKYGMFFLLILIFPFGGSSLISYILNPTISFIINLLIPGFSII